MTSIDDIVAELGRSAVRHRSFGRQYTLPTEIDIAFAEMRLGARFPADFREFLRRFGALLIEEPPVVREAHRRATRRGFYVFGVGAEVPEFLEVVRVARELHAETGERLIPFLKPIGVPMFLCFDSESRIREVCPGTAGGTRQVGLGFSAALVRAIRAMSPVVRFESHRQPALRAC